MAKHLPLLIIGAGPYGLGMLAYATHKNIEHVVVGKTMEFWKSNMPNGMAACKELPNGELEVSLDGSTLVVDQIILVTGYKVNVEQITLLTNGNILAHLATRNGFPQGKYL